MLQWVVTVEMGLEHKPTVKYIKHQKGDCHV